MPKPFVIPAGMEADLARLCGGPADDELFDIGMQATHDPEGAYLALRALLLRRNGKLPAAARTAGSWVEVAWAADLLDSRELELYGERHGFHPGVLRNWRTAVRHLPAWAVQLGRAGLMSHSASLGLFPRGFRRPPAPAVLAAVREHDAVRLRLSGEVKAPLRAHFLRMLVLLAEDGHPHHGGAGHAQRS